MLASILVGFFKFHIELRIKHRFASSHCCAGFLTIVLANSRVAEVSSSAGDQSKNSENAKIQKVIFAKRQGTKSKNSENAKIQKVIFAKRQGTKSKRSENAQIQKVIFAKRQGTKSKRGPGHHAWHHYCLREKQSKPRPITYGVRECRY